MTTLREAAQQALEAWDTRAGIDTASRAFEALRAALAEPVQDHFPDATKMVQEPVACLIGTKGSAFDSPTTKRAYTYAEQPGNVVASRLGLACNAAASQSAGDSIDRGLGLLQELQRQGFGVFDLGAEYTSPPQRPAEPVQESQGCDHCNHWLYAGIKCRMCGRVTEPVQDTGVKLKPVFYAPRRLDDAEVEDIIKRNAAITESILNINFKEPQPGMVNLDAFHVFHFNDPPKGGFVGEIEMLKWLVRNRDGDYWKAKHGVQEPPCATRECMPSECPNCASLQDQNTELDRKLAEMEQTSLELCETCGWRTLIPGDCCLNCVRQQPKA